MAPLRDEQVLRLTTVNHSQCLICYLEGRRYPAYPSMRVVPAWPCDHQLQVLVWKRERRQLLLRHLQAEHVGHPLVNSVLGVS